MDRPGPPDGGPVLLLRNTKFGRRGLAAMGGTRLQDFFDLCFCYYQSVDLPFYCFLGESIQIHMEFGVSDIFYLQIGCGCSRQWHL